jgi:hypothetical protein
MPMYLVTSVIDEGVYDDDFRVVEASSPLAVVENMLKYSYKWKGLLSPAYLWDEVRDGEWTASELLERINKTWVDGDSRAQVRIHEIKEIERLKEDAN